MLLDLLYEDTFYHFISKKVSGKNKRPIPMHFQCIIPLNEWNPHERFTKNSQKSFISHVMPPPPPPPWKHEDKLGSALQERSCCCIPIMTRCKEENQNGLLVHFPREYSGNRVRNTRWGPRQCRVRRRWVGTEVRNNSLYILNDSLL